MEAIKVRPGKWLKDNKYPIRVLYDDKEYSVIWGKYDNIKVLGVRWNESNTEKGYPVGRGGPEWYIEPDFIAIAILQRLLNLAIDNKDKKYLNLKDIKYAINELIDKMTLK